MDAKFILLVALVAAVGLGCFLLGLFVGSRRGRHDGRMIAQQSPLAPAPANAAAASRAAPGSVNLQLGRELEQLISAGKKINAIKLVRERTGLSLKESKEAAERLEELMEKRLKGMIDEKARVSRENVSGG